MHHMVKSWLLIHPVVTQHALLTLAHHSLRGTAVVTSSFTQSIDQALTHIFYHFKKRLLSVYGIRYLFSV